MFASAARRRILYVLALVMSSQIAYAKEKVCAHVQADIAILEVKKDIVGGFTHVFRVSTDLDKGPSYDSSTLDGTTVVIVETEMHNEAGNNIPYTFSVRVFPGRYSQEAADHLFLTQSPVIRPYVRHVYCYVDGY